VLLVSIRMSLLVGQSNEGRVGCNSQLLQNTF
jgi:hypothetical protein